MNIDSLCPRDDLQAQWKVKACSKTKGQGRRQIHVTERIVH